MAQSVHLHERRHLPGVAEVVFVAALRHRRDGLRLDRDEPRLDLAVNSLADDRIREAGEVRATADAADHEGRSDVRLLELLLHLEADDRLVHQDVVQDAAQRILRVLPGDRGLDRLGDRDSKGPRMVRVLREELLPDVRLIARTRDDLGPVQVHHVLAVWLLSYETRTMNTFAFSPK